MKISGMEVRNAVKPISITVEKGDINHAKRKQPDSCAMALACKRQLGTDGVRIHLGRTYLQIGRKWVRYLTSEALRAEIIAYDRGGKFMPGTYMLYAITPTKRTGKRQGSAKPAKYKKRTKIYHVTTDVRHHGSIDGIISKRAEIMVVLTTNFVEKLNPVILRPGRLDAVISLRAPNGKTVEKLIRHYAGNLLSDDVDLTAAGVELSGQIPASIRECVERAKLGMVRRQDSKLSAIDLVTAARTMKNHLALLNRDQKVETPAEMLANSLRSVVHNGGQTVSDIQPMVQETLELTRDINNTVN